MYLYVFLFLLMAIIGLYTQVFMLGVAKMEARQKTLAEIMLLWHEEAVAHVRTNIATLYSGAPPLPAAPFCAVSKETVVPSPASNCVPLMALPASFSVDIQMNSVAYQVGGTNYVATYVIDGPGGYAKAGYRAGEIRGQFQASDIPAWMQGVVAAGNCGGSAGNWFFTTAIVGADPLCFPARSGATTFVPDGAVGLISIVQ